MTVTNTQATMKIVQNPLSDNHLSAMFFDGVVATGEKNGKKYTLKTFQDGEIGYHDKDGRKDYSGAEIRSLGEINLIDDMNIDSEDNLDIFVDKFFVITEEGQEVDVDVYDDNMYFDEYEEAIEGFENFLNKL